MRVLIDECLPVECRLWFEGHTAETVAYRGWKGTKNGALLALAVEAGFDAFLTADRVMYREHDLSLLPLAVIVVPTNNIIMLRILASAICKRVLTCKPGSYTELPLPDPTPP
jgi:hypothetical protein